MIEIKLTDPKHEPLTGGGTENGPKLMSLIEQSLENWSQHLAAVTGEGANRYEVITVRNFLYGALTKKYELKAKEGAQNSPLHPTLP